MKPVDYLILGHGYTADVLIKSIALNEPDVLVKSTSRNDESKIYFDLKEPASWSNLPEANNLVWTFPAEPLEVVKKFYEQTKNKFKNKVVIGSTSALEVKTKDEWVDENTNLDLSIERVKSESFLMQKGYNLLLSSGIYGPKRNPVNWVRKGMVGKSSKFVNMIHVEDLCQFILKTMNLPDEAQVLIASDNNPLTWFEIIDALEEAKIVESIPEKSSSRLSKRIRCDQSINKLGIHLKHPNFIESVIKLNNES